MVPQNHRRSSLATASWALNATTCRLSPYTVKTTTLWTLTCLKSYSTNHFARIWWFNQRTHLWSWAKTRCTRRMLDLSLQSLCSSSSRYRPSSSVKTPCWPHSLVDARLLSCLTQGTKQQQQLRFMMATLYRRVLCATRSVARPYLKCCKITWVRSTMQRWDLDTHSSANLRQSMVRSTLMFKVYQFPMWTLHTNAGVNHRSSTILRHSCCISTKSH